MANVIKRTVVSTVIKASKIEMKEGKFSEEELKPITIVGVKVPEDRIEGKVKAQYGKENKYFVKAVEYQETNYEMELETFLKYAKEVKPETVETVETVETEKTKTAVKTA